MPVSFSPSVLAPALLSGVCAAGFFALSSASASGEQVVSPPVELCGEYEDLFASAGQFFDVTCSTTVTGSADVSGATFSSGSDRARLTFLGSSRADGSTFNVPVFVGDGGELESSGGAFMSVSAATGTVVLDGVTVSGAAAFNAEFSVRDSVFVGDGAGAAVVQLGGRLVQVSEPMRSFSGNRVDGEVIVRSYTSDFVGNEASLVRVDAPLSDGFDASGVGEVVVGTGTLVREGDVVVWPQGKPLFVTHKTSSAYVGTVDGSLVLRDSVVEPFPGDDVSRVDVSVGASGVLDVVGSTLAFAGGGGRSGSLKSEGFVSLVDSTVHGRVSLAGAFDVRSSDFSEVGSDPVVLKTTQEFAGETVFVGNVVTNGVVFDSLGSSTPGDFTDNDPGDTMLTVSGQKFTAGFNPTGYAKSGVLVVPWPAGTADPLANVEAFSWPGSVPFLLKGGAFGAVKFSAPFVSNGADIRVVTGDGAGSVSVEADVDWSGSRIDLADGGRVQTLSSAVNVRRGASLMLADADVREGSIWAESDTVVQVRGSHLVDSSIRSAGELVVENTDVVNGYVVASGDVVLGDGARVYAPAGQWAVTVDGARGATSVLQGTPGNPVVISSACDPQLSGSAGYDDRCPGVAPWLSQRPEGGVKVTAAPLPLPSEGNFRADSVVFAYAQTGVRLERIQGGFTSALIQSIGSGSFVPSDILSNRIVNSDFVSTNVAVSGSSPWIGIAPACVYDAYALLVDSYRGDYALSYTTDIVGVATSLAGVSSVPQVSAGSQGEVAQAVKKVNTLQDDVFDYAKKYTTGDARNYLINRGVMPDVDLSSEAATAGSIAKIAGFSTDFSWGAGSYDNTIDLNLEVCKVPAAPVPVPVPIMNPVITSHVAEFGRKAQPVTSYGQELLGWPTGGSTLASGMENIAASSYGLASSMLLPRPWVESTAPVPAEGYLIPDPVTGVGKKVVGPGVVELSWDAPVQDLAVGGYRVQVRPVGGVWDTVEDGVLFTSTTVSGLDVDTVYEARVQAVAAGGSWGEFSPAVSFRAGPPAAPSVVVDTSKRAFFDGKCVGSVSFFLSADVVDAELTDLEYFLAVDASGSSPVTVSEGFTAEVVRLVSGTDCDPVVSFSSVGPGSAA